MEVAETLVQEDSGPGLVLFLLLAGVGGFLSSSGANVMAWSEYQKRKGKEWSKCQSFGFSMACLFLNLTGIGMFLASTALGGAVATVMPIQTGANLLGNMFWQTLLGMKYYTKSMRVGTIVLICAVMELSDIGPQEPAKFTQEEIRELMTHPLAIAWNSIMLLCVVLTMYGVKRTLHHAMESSLKLFLFVALVTFSTVIGASIGKLLGLVKGWAWYMVAFLYFFDGVICLGGTVLANGHCDVSLFIPAQLSSQLVVNMITGYLVWGDAKYVHQPLAYILVYALCILGVYLNSPAMDIIGGLTRWYSIRSSKLSAGLTGSNFGEQVLKLLQMWQGNSAMEAGCRDQLGAVLHRGLETGAIKEHELINLVLLLCREKQYGPSPLLVHWLEDLKLFQIYCEHDPAFKDSFRQTLTTEDYHKLVGMKEELIREISSFASTVSVPEIMAGSGISLGDAARSFGGRTDRLLA